MNRLSTERRRQILAALVEGTSIRATCRLTGSAKGTVIRLLEELGDVCMAFHDETMREIPAKQVQCDELWSFVGAKQRNVKPERKAERIGDAWTYVAIDSDTKLVINWFVGRKDGYSANRFMVDLADRLAGRCQLTTDGRHTYPEAVERAFGWAGCDYAQLVKLFGPSYDSSPDSRYSPPKCNGTVKEWVMGKPQAEMVSTSHIERQNLTVRMQNRRFTRLTNAFSKSFDNHVRSLAIHFVWYNFVRVHKTLTKRAGGIHTTPAMAAGLTSRVWKLEDVLALLDRKAVSPSK
jgi:IS1 family transposase